MAKRDTTVEEKLHQFIKEYGCDRCSLEVLWFLSRHPQTRFSRLAIVHASNSPRLDVEKALRHLRDRQLLTTYSENGTDFYLLTQNESLHKLLLKLLSTEWIQWQRVLKQACTVSLK